MNVLQIANDYLNPLFERMFDSIARQGVKNKVVVPIRYDGIVDDNWSNDIVVLKCFSNLDRILFHKKQRKIIEAIDDNVQVGTSNIIHAHTLFSAGYAAMKLSKKYGIPYMIAVRNTDVNTFFRHMPHLRKTGVRILSEAAAIVFLSPAYMKEVINTYVPLNQKDQIGEKSVVIPSGISKVFFENMGKPKKNPKRDELTIVFVGNLTVNKNIEKIIESSHTKNNNYKITKILIIGELIDQECLKYIDNPIVEYHSKCNQRELIDYYRSGDIFLMPSHTETFGLVYAEAMSQGLPVLYTKGQGFDGQFEDGTVGYAVNDNSVDDINKKIEMVISRYEEVSTNCVRLCKRFDWNEIAGEYNQLYSKVLGSKKGG